ncbi:MAG: glycosyltransferase [Chitinophagaceae bacterium]|nr:glycosyltransferase [Chitinophagaceae bacterium]
MKVIIHQGNGFLTKDKTLNSFISGTITEMCKTQAEHGFIWLSYDNADASLKIEAAKHVLLKQPVFTSLWKQMWFNRQIASVIKTEQPSCVFCINGKKIPTHIPQCILVTQDNNKPAHTFPADMHVITLSAFLQQRLIERGHHSENVHVIRPKASELFLSAVWDTRESVKKKYTAGTEYFFFSVHNTSNGQALNVLKAFSLFKKWQKSNTRLLIYAEEASASSRWKKSLDTYKYREHVIIQDAADEEERALVTACAMCVLYFPEYDSTGLPLLECIQAQVAVITHAIGAIAETTGDAALYCNGENIEDIADKMKKIYRDEKLRTRLMSRIAEKAAACSNNRAAEQLWAVIQQVSSQNNQ